MINNPVSLKLPHRRHSCNLTSYNVFKSLSSRHKAVVTSAAAAQHMSGVGTAAAEMQQEVAKPLCDRRSYQHAILDNGLRVLAVQDTDAVFAAACANVQAGYFDDKLSGAAHFLEHMVHLGSDAFPDEKEYKAFLAKNGGSSNASTSMVHTRYHFKVHASALGGALARLGAALSSPLLAEDSAAREVENVHAEYSRNTNSDSRKLLQLKRSLCGTHPYSGFSTGSIETLWEDPKAAGVSVPGVLRELWGACYTAEATTVAVVGPQETQELLQLVQEAFRAMRSSSNNTGAGVAGSSGSNGTAAAAAAAAAKACSSAVSVSSSSSSSSSGSDSSADEASDGEAVGTVGIAAAAAAAAPEAAVHAKAQQESLLDLAGVGGEGCSQIAAPEHHTHHMQHQQGYAQPQLDPQQQPQQQQQQQPKQVAHAQQSSQRYPVDVCSAAAFGQLVCVCPQRDLREVQVVWYIPAGIMAHSSVKPWHLASHLLGHEVPGSVAHLLKAQGLVQSLSVGAGDEVRLGAGWMYWGATLTLTQEGEDQLEHVLATLMRGVQVLQCCGDAVLHQHWQECAALAALRFDWRDQAEPLAAAQAAAHTLHYYPPSQVLSGPTLMTSFDITAIRWFLRHLTPERMTVFYSSRRHQGATTSKEPFYGAHYTAGPLPQPWLASIQAYQEVDRQQQAQPVAGCCDSTSLQKPTAAASAKQQQQGEGENEGESGRQVVPLPGELYLPPPNWAIPTDMQLRPLEQQQQQQVASDGAVPTAVGPCGIIQQPGLCVWHHLDTSYGLPKVHLKLHIVTPAVYATPEATVAARLLVRVLDDVLLPVAYPAELAGSSYSLSTGQGGLLLKVEGFTGVVQQLMLEVLTALQGLTPEQVCQRFTTMKGRLTQGLTNWANNNPAQHSEYAADHLLQAQHHHNSDLLTAAAASQPDHILSLQQQLLAGANMHLDMLTYGNISSSEAGDLAGRLQQLLPAQGLVNPGVWPPLGRVYSLSPLALSDRANDSLAAATAAAHQELPASHTVSMQSMPSKQCGETGAAAAAAAVEEEEGASGSSAGSSGPGPVVVTYLPDNPNPSNTNNAVYYCVQLGPDSVPSAVLCELFAQMSSKPAFHELRTRQRLGYSVHLCSTSLQRQLGLVVRVQSPSTAPDAVTAAVRGWMAGFREELSQLAQDSLDSHKQSLLAKYLEPAKSLSEAARRAWLPIGSSRTLVFDRRQQKAAAVQAITQQQLMDWYASHVHPEGGLHHALCVQVWGGVGPAPDCALEAAAAMQQGPGSSGVVCAQDVAGFKRGQPVLPLPDFQLPPTSASG